MNRKPTFYTSNYELDALENILALQTRMGTNNTREND